MKLVIANKDNVVEGKYYLEYVPSKFPQIFLAKYDDKCMKCISKTHLSGDRSKARLFFCKEVFVHFISWCLNEVTGTLYELDEEEVLQYIVMEEL